RPAASASPSASETTSASREASSARSGVGSTTEGASHPRRWASPQADSSARTPSPRLVSGSCSSMLRGLLVEEVHVEGDLRHGHLLHLLGGPAEGARQPEGRAHQGSRGQLGLFFFP